MRIPGLGRAALSLRRARARWLPGAAILGYHRIADARDDPFALAVAPARFREHLEVLAADARPMRLGDLTHALRTGSLPARAVAITFDDGYAELLHTALPLLERRDLPATAFVATGFLGREFWWDALARTLLAAAPAGQLVVEVGGRAHTLDGADPRAAVARAYELLRGADPDQRAAALDRLRSRTAAAARESAAPTAGSARRARGLTHDELLRLSAHGLVEVGSHTITHPCLAGLPRESQHREVHDSRIELESTIGRPVTSFSYPNGSASRATVAAVREAGYARACSSTFDAAHSRSDPWRLPRLWPRDVDGGSFARWLAGWLPRR